MTTRVLRSLCLPGLVFVLWTAAGCRVVPDRALACPADQVIYRGFDEPPHARLGSYPSATIGTFFLGPDLGPHGYYFPPAERYGIAYTCRGGTIDVVHVRIAVDRTAYVAAETYRHLMNHDDSFVCGFAVNRSRFYLTLTYPENWDRMSKHQQRKIAREVALTVGPNVAFQMTTWHEMLTWYGYGCMGPFSEFPSAFSWEDSYSNLLGTIVAVRALQDGDHKYNEAVKIALDQEMQTLSILPACAAKRATSTMRGQWWTGDIFFEVDMKKRNFDIGLDNGYITPTLIPHVAECPDAEPMPYPVPRLDVLARYGFAAQVQIEPHDRESGKILRLVHGDRPPKRINPEEHFALIMTDIRREAVALYGPEYEPAPTHNVLQATETRGMSPSLRQGDIRNTR